MSSDEIVTRLREQHASFRVAVGVNQNIVLDSLYTEAADEIERLRTSGKQLLDALTEMSEKGMLPKITFRLRDAAQTFEQAVRGE